MKLQDDLLKKTLKLEGGFVNHKDDKGGMTIFGISRKFHPDHSVWIDVDKILNASHKLGLSYGESMSVYYKNEASIRKTYQSYADWIPESCSFKSQLFDFSVNAGIKNAQRIYSKSADFTMFKANVIEYYRAISVKYPMFRRGWQSRLRQVYGDSKIVL